MNIDTLFLNWYTQKVLRRSVSQEIFNPRMMITVYGITCGGGNEEMMKSGTSFYICQYKHDEMV